jgi:hypothetical protein
MEIPKQVRNDKYIILDCFALLAMTNEKGLFRLGQNVFALADASKFRLALQIK